MKYLLSLFTALVLSCSAYSQVTLTGTVHCQVDSLVGSVTGGIIPTSAGIVADDNWSTVFPLGFTFNFYGTPNTQCIIGSNGAIGFDLSYALAYNTWPINNTLLGSTAAAPDMVNCICGPWCDVLISAGGSMQYSMQGTAPNRNFAMTWCGTHMFGCTTEWLTTQIILYESSNLAEVHIGHRTICTTGWNGSHAIVGVKNAAGTDAVTPAGRDYPSIWATTNEGWRFTPSGSTYTVSSIPYAPIPYAASAVYWYDSTSGAYLGTAIIGVAPTVPTTYKAAVLGCSDTTFAYLHIDPPGVVGGGSVPHIDTYSYMDPSVCGVCNGSITLYGVNPHQVDSVFYSFNHTRYFFIDSAGIDSTITIHNLCEGLYDTVYVKVGTCPSNIEDPITLVGPHLFVTGQSYTNPTMCGKNDGTITLRGLFPSQPCTVSYTKQDTTLSTDTIGSFSGVTLGDSTITVTGLRRGIYRNIVATIGLCSAPADTADLINPPPFPASFTYDTVLHCDGDEVIVTNTSTPRGTYSTFYFDFGDNTIDSSGSIPLSHIYNDAPSYQGVYNIQLRYNMYDDHTCNTFDTLKNLTYDHHISAFFVQDHNAVCIGNAITFMGSSNSLNMPNYTWNFGDGSSVLLSNPNPGTPDGDTVSYTYTLPSQNDMPFTTKLTVTDSIGCKISWTDTSQVVFVDIHTTTHDTSVCLRDPMLLIALPTVTPSEVPFTLSWTPTDNITPTNDIQSMVSFMSIGDFTYTVSLTTNDLGCEASDAETIHSYPPVTLTGVTTSPQTISYGGQVYLNASGATRYTWVPTNGTLSDPNINDPIATPTDSTSTYIVFGMNNFGCRDSATVVINLDYSSIMDGMPTGFTPNGDGKNDKFKVTPLKYQKLVDFRVYNRWGQEVFHTANPADGWDGNFQGVPQDLGVYSYVIIVAYPEGGNKTYKGTVTLLR